MNLLNRISAVANSAFVTARCRWPSAGTLRVYWGVMAVLALLMAGDMARSGYAHALSLGLSGWPLAGRVALSALLGVFITGYLSLVILLVWGMFYRIGTEVAGGYRSFRAWAPGAWQSTREASASAIGFLRSIPARIAGFFRAIGRGLAWIAGRPAWWRSLDRKEKFGVVFGTAFFAVFVGIIVAFYPVARALGAMLPSWAPMADVPVLQALFIDLFLGSLIGCLVTSILATICSAAFKRNSNR